MSSLTPIHKYVDSFMEFNEHPLLDNAGKVSQKQMKTIAGQRYEEFDRHRKAAEAELEDKRELEALEALEKRLKNKKEKDAK